MKSLCAAAVNSGRSAEKKRGFLTMCIALFRFIVAFMLCGCASTRTLADRDDAIKEARRIVDQREDWDHGADLSAREYKIGGRQAGWIVTAWRISDPDSPRENLDYTSTRYSAGQVVSLTLDNNGRILYYLPGVP